MNTPHAGPVCCKAIKRNCTSGLGGQSAHESEIKNPGFVSRGLDSQMPRLERRGTASENTADERCLLASTLLIRWYRRVIIALSPLWALVSTVGQEIGRASC